MPTRRLAVCCALHSTSHSIVKHRDQGTWRKSQTPKQSSQVNNTPEQEDINKNRNRSIQARSCRRPPSPQLQQIVTKNMIGKRRLLLHSPLHVTRQLLVVYTRIRITIALFTADKGLSAAIRPGVGIILGQDEFGALEGVRSCGAGRGIHRR